MSRPTLALLAVVVLALPGCGGGGRAAEPADATRQITVSAGASLRHVFERLGAQFTAAHPGVSVIFNHGPSSSLAEQIVHGAPADVFAAANPETMEKVVRARKAAAQPSVFATNVLQIAVPRGNPAQVSGLRDFARPELVIAVCAEQVPCGRAAARALAAGGVAGQPDTFEQDVTAVLTKVQLGEVDAGLVYRTDVRAAQGRVRGIDFPEAAKAINHYLIVPVRGSQAGSTGRAFIDHVRSPRGRAVLAAAGFGTP